MVLTASDLLRLGLTLMLALLAYGRLSSLLRFALPGRVRHAGVPDLGEPAGPLAQGLRAAGFRYLGGRSEHIFGIHRRLAAVYAHPDGRVVDLPITGRLAGGYVMTFYVDGRCALTRAGAGRDVVVDRYRSRTVSPRQTLQDLLEAHRESERGMSLGEATQPVSSLEERLEMAERWYREHARSELAVPALLDGLLLAAIVVFGIYLWSL